LAHSPITCKFPKIGSFYYLTFSRSYDGSGGRDRTYDKLINSQLLYR
jgi:hypothetical protein